MTRKALTSLTTELPDSKKMPVTGHRVAVIAALSALALLAAATVRLPECSSESENLGLGTPGTSLYGNGLVSR